MTVIAIGSPAPGFTLNDQNGKKVSLGKLRGRRVILSFRPLAWTPVCHDQMLSLEEHYDRLAALNTVALGMGVDSSASNKAWAASMNITRTKLLADFWPHGAVTRSYGLLREADGFPERANVIVDEAGKVVFARVYPIGQLPDIDELIALLEK
jgi:peroxiredoxin